MKIFFKYRDSHYKDSTITWPHFYQTRSAWSMNQGSNKNHSPAYNFAPTVTKFCVMWEGLSLPHDTKFGNCRCKIVDSRAFPSWSLIHGLRWSGLIKAEPDHLIFTMGIPKLARLGLCIEMGLDPFHFICGINQRKHRCVFGAWFSTGHNNCMNGWWRLTLNVLNHFRGI